MILYKYLHERLGSTVALSLTEETVHIGDKAEHNEISVKETIVELFIDYLIDVWEPKWLAAILKNAFFYHEETERQDIITIAKSIFDGQKRDLPATDTLPSRREVLHNAIEALFMETDHFNIEALATFRLNAYFDCLNRYVEIAIDEYKLEQDYSFFIDKLRRIVRSYKPLRTTIYAVDQGTFQLYDETFKPINNIQSVRSFYPLLKQWGIEAEPSILLTLVGLAPLKIHMFTDRREDSMIQTLQKVFEERVVFHRSAEAHKIHL